MSTSAAGTTIYPSDRTDDEGVEQRRFGATSAVAAEAEQGDGPAAASATSSAVGEGIAETSAVSVVAGPNYAAAACDHGVVVVGPYGCSAASEVGVATVGPHGAAASSNAANATSVALDRDGAVIDAAQDQGSTT